MHFNFDWSAGQIIWTLTFAAHLVLLVVLLGRDRARRFVWFTIGISLVALRLLASRLLFNRLPQFTLGIIFVILADISVVVSLLVLLELARRAFGAARRRLSVAWILAFIVLGGIVVATWGHWPAWKTLAPMSTMVFLSLLQLFAQKGGLLVDVLTILLGILMITSGNHYRAGWRTHTQRIMIGLSTASLAQIAVQAIWQVIAKTAKPHSAAEYERIIGLRDKLFNADSVVYLAVVVWWIAMLWMDEPGRAEFAEIAVPVGPGTPSQHDSAKVELPDDPNE
jgi:hypothetical protein